MEINQNNKLITSNNSWDVEMAMEDQLEILHDSISFNSLWPSYPLHQTHQFPTSLSSSSSSTTTTTTTTTLFGTSTTHDHHHHQEEEEEEEGPEEEEEEEEELGAMKEMMYRIAAMQPVDIDPATIRKPKRRNIRISDDPQSVAARHRRERISEKIRILQRLVPGGTKMDTASMLDEAIRYVKFLKRQIRILQSNPPPPLPPLPPPPPPCIGDWQLITQTKHNNSNNNNNNLVVGVGVAVGATTSSNSLGPHPGLAFGTNGGGGGGGGGAEPPTLL